MSRCDEEEPFTYGIADGVWSPGHVEIVHLSGPESAVMEEPGDLALEPPWHVQGFGPKGTNKLPKTPAD